MDQPDLIKRFLEHRDVLFGFVFALTLDHDVAEEVFQEVGVAILSEVAKGTAPDHFLAWARGLARHRVADHYRRESRRREVEGTLTSDPEARLELLAGVVDQAFAENENDDDHQARLKHLRDCVQRLGGRARAIVDARYRERKALKDIASALSWQETSIKVALSKARKALAECIDRRVANAGTQP